jgi:oligoribonuclease NrnB/cAMP/cGMP phosphodiesterase (DHH superfamily)
LGVERIPRKKKDEPEKEPEPEPEKEPEPEPEKEPEPEPEKEPEPEPEKEPEPEPEKEPEPKPKKKPGPKPKKESKPKPKKKPGPKPKKESKPKPKKEPEPEPEKEPEIEPEKEPEPEPEPAPKPQEVFDITDDSRKVTIITHLDCDGLLCAATVLKAIKEQGGEEPKYRMFYTTSSRIFSTLAESIPQIPPGKNPFSIGDLYVCDITLHRDAVLGSTIYDNVVWVDHHVKESFADELQSGLPTVTLILDPDADSAAELVANHFEMDSGFESIAKNIDSNDLKTPEEERLRDLVEANIMKHSRSPGELSAHLFELAKECAEDISGVSDEKYNTILEEYNEWLTNMNELLTKNLKVHEINNKNVALFETQDPAPVYALLNTLKDHEKAPFDLFAVIMHRPGGRKDRSSIGNPLTKIEFRTQTDLNVYDIAKSFGGGGHKNASGAVVVDGIKGYEFIKRIESSGYI